MVKRIFKSIMAVALSVLLISAIFISRQIYNDLIETQIDELKIATEMLGYGISENGLSFINNFTQYNNRITIIDSDGSVLFDNTKNIDELDNHLNRQEVKEAIETGFGVSTRYSSTLTSRYIYTATKLNNGWIVRLSSQYNSIVSVLLSILAPLLIVCLLMIIISSVLANRLANRIVSPLNSIDLDNPNTDYCYKEIKPFMDKIINQQSEINNHIISLERKKQEFETLTENMNEGMVLLNSKGIILDVNRFGALALELSKDDIGENINKSAHYNQFASLLSESENSKTNYKNVKINDVSYEIEVSSILSGGQLIGSVILVFDNSYKEANEKIRKEFSSNVSHELKTPLQTISGYSELLKSGMVKDDDQLEVAQRIYNESQRMIALVNDIIKLSHLDDEKTNIELSSISIMPIITSTINTIETFAAKQNISISLNGDDYIVYGNQQLVESIVFNLIDNAIKYNRPNGTIQINLFEKDDNILFQVKDSGVGISKDDLERIFERFYQVDKARSKKVGGTGLGLSIVKHACILIDAQIKVDSKLNEGTSFTVTFKKG